MQLCPPQTDESLGSTSPLIVLNHLAFWTWDGMLISLHARKGFHWKPLFRDVDWVGGTEDFYWSHRILPVSARGLECKPSWQCLERSDRGFRFLLGVSRNQGGIIWSLGSNTFPKSGTRVCLCFANLC